MKPFAIALPPALRHLSGEYSKYGIQGTIRRPDPGLDLFRWRGIGNVCAARKYLCSKTDRSLDGAASGADNAQHAGLECEVFSTRWTHLQVLLNFLEFLR